ncbi:cytochrome d ubiquinol oxidase subunit II [Mucilaginibacter myungsuensis]|nr:cytochrome d ubiquinol oxidase subunit II [Mucilaginibacter myungsuensis]
MMLYIVIAFLWWSILLYLLMGGADYGAGILELLTREGNRAGLKKTAYRAIGPIWEANHMWLIIAVVIIFVGFPDVYSLVSVHLHIPLTIMLMGIIARGTAFTFRNYDAVHDSWHRLYDRIYMYSSFITPMFLGIIAATAISGRIDTDATDFPSGYILNWFNWFPLSVGLFTVCLCGSLAAIFLAGEVPGSDEKWRFIRKAKQMNGLATLFMVLLFVSASLQGIPLFRWLFGNVISLIADVIAAASLAMTWYMIYQSRVKTSRFYAGLMVMSLLISVSYPHFPNIVLLKNGGSLSILDHAAPSATINALGIALLAGSVFILPALVYLIWSFAKKRSVVDEDH